MVRQYEQFGHHRGSTNSASFGNGKRLVDENLKSNQGKIQESAQTSRTISLKTQSEEQPRIPVEISQQRAGDGALRYWEGKRATLMIAVEVGSLRNPSHLLVCSCLAILSAQSAFLLVISINHLDCRELVVCYFNVLFYYQIPHAGQISNKIFIKLNDSSSKKADRSNEIMLKLTTAVMAKNEKRIQGPNNSWVRSGWCRCHSGI
ncbi:hypothetical protein V1527DRAFT_296691 [Lipomyces starkeyi]